MDGKNRFLRGPRPWGCASFRQESRAQVPLIASRGWDRSRPDGFTIDKGSKTLVDLKTSNPYDRNMAKKKSKPAKVE